MIDDSRAICMAVGRTLATGRDTVFCSVNDPREAVETARKFRPTVILLDLEMPNLSGFDVLKLLREDPSSSAVPVIMLSGNDDPEVKANAFMLGANDYAEKNMSPSELNSRIDYHTNAYVNSLRITRYVEELTKTKQQVERQRDFIKSTFGRYVSDEIVDTILTAPGGLELGGENRVVSILMADLRGFTSLAEGLPPETVLSIVNNFLQRMTDVLLDHQGTIDEFIGDAVLAIFGAPVLRDDDARRSVACALDMQRAMAEVNEWNRSRGFPEVAMGIGINTGEVVVGNIGSVKRSKYGVVGSTVNLTSRIESYTEGGQILVSDATAEAIGSDLITDRTFEVQPKGVSSKVTLHLVTGLGS
jgi:adenylate cyclase